MTKVKNRISSKQKNDILVKNIIVININDLIFGVSLFGFFYDELRTHLATRTLDGFKLYYSENQNS